MNFNLFCETQITDQSFALCQACYTVLELLAPRVNMGKTGMKNVFVGR